MGLRANPTQRQRRLGVELRRLREAAGMSATEAATFAGLSSPHLGHIEAARTAIPEGKLRALATAYGCQNEPLIEALVEMSAATGKGWWSDYRAPVHNQNARDLAEIESSSVAVRSFQWVHMPGLLQTTEYMRSLFAGSNQDASPEEIDKYVDFRKRRQQILTDDAPPTIHAVIHEAALHMQFVGVDVMSRQIEHLVELSRLPHVCIQILPFKAAYPATFGTPFVLFEGAVPELNTVYIEHPVSSPFIHEPAHLDGFAATFSQLGAAALPPVDLGIEPEFHAKKDSLGLIQHVLYAM
ncbi:helix-turn-helix domain-containing protein [Streptomyces halobius]|uniref:Helix-turn-helix domain-containing protein n=1 Tax=Streptomyces halobius TaxID=2879846 RepID=A0ABY4M812_9ACTN|nr:helix-turn-helix transcriptional regulator [Streptomyces halobius]UQA93882.1 helix-turn-helix domain-containing protein [Streptomyces halobius]